MNHSKVVLVGALLGTLIGLISATMATLIKLTSFEQTANMTPIIQPFYTLALFGLVDGLLIGALSGAMGHAWNIKEYGVLRVLMSVAIASVHIMAGNFENQSLLPVVIYGLAIFNGIFIAPVVLGILHRIEFADEKRLAA